MSQNKILLKRKALEAALETIRFKIKHLQKYYSREQVRCWYVERNNLVRHLHGLPTEKQIQQSCKRVNFSNSFKYNKQ